MIIPDRKKAVSVILSKAMPDGNMGHVEKKEEHGIDEHSQVMLGIAEDLMNGFKSGSASAIASALKAAFDACASKPESSEE